MISNINKNGRLQIVSKVPTFRTLPNDILTHLQHADDEVFNNGHLGAINVVDHINALRHGDEKLHYVHKMYPEHKNAFHVAPKESPTIFHHAANLHKKGYSHLHVVVGEDRVNEFKESLNKYNVHFDAKGNGYHFKSIKVSSAGHRDPDAECTEGMSASKMRHHTIEGNTEEFKKGLHPALRAHAEEIMKKIKDRIK